MIPIDLQPTILSRQDRRDSRCINHPTGMALHANTLTILPRHLLLSSRIQLHFGHGHRTK